MNAPNNVHSLPSAPLEFEVAGKRYRAHKLDVFDQGHVARRIAPLIPTLLPIFIQMAGVVRGTAPEPDKELNEEERKAQAVKFINAVMAILDKPEVLQPFTDALANLTDDKFEYVINKCLSVVRGTRNDTDWVPVWNLNIKRANFAEMNELAIMLPIVVQVIKDSLGNFITGLLSAAGLTPTAQM